AAFAADGAVRAMPLVSAGMGTASLLVATLFLWALLTNLLSNTSEAEDGDVEKIAFGGAALVFTMLMALAIVDADPSMLTSATGYFAALLLSWLATKVEFLENTLSMGTNPKASEQPLHNSNIARAMASSAAHHNLLAKIARRERT
ncbi:MAG: hypothetical protein ACRCU5_13385, partial [Rhizobiaceae bacterium]